MVVNTELFSVPVRVSDIESYPLYSVPSLAENFGSGELATLSCTSEENPYMPKPAFNSSRPDI